MHSKSYASKNQNDIQFGMEGVHSLLLNGINNHFSMHHNTQDIEFARMKNHNCCNTTI